MNSLGPSFSHHRILIRKISCHLARPKPVSAPRLPCERTSKVAAAASSCCMHYPPVSSDSFRAPPCYLIAPLYQTRLCALSLVCHLFKPAGRVMRSAGTCHVARWDETRPSQVTVLDSQLHISRLASSQALFLGLDWHGWALSLASCGARSMSRLLRRLSARLTIPRRARCPFPSCRNVGFGLVAAVPAPRVLDSTLLSACSKRLAPREALGVDDLV